MQRSTSHLHGSISLPTSPKLLSDPYKYDYQRRRTKSTKSSTACPDAASPPSAKRLERLVSELENIRLSEVRSLESFFEFPVFAISVFRPTVAISSFDILFFCVLEICVEFCAINPTSYSQTLVALTASRDSLPPLATSSDPFTAPSLYALMVTRRRRALYMLLLKPRLPVFR
ncbi:hypothetical protein DFH06DRAFT_1340220 [Mycena polygramma]|nr:hypothetical protein DFH06DRAFT_1340220 [Mycena polygramma]